MRPTMTRYASLLLLLCACSSESTGDALDDGGTTGEPDLAWPACLEDGTCGALETLTDAAACEEDGLRAERVEIAWGILDGTELEEAGSAAGECGEPLRWVYDEPASLNAYQVTFTWTEDAAAWSCTTTGADFELEAGLGDTGQLELTGPYPWPSETSDCCLVSGAPVDGFAQVPCSAEES